MKWRTASTQSRDATALFFNKVNNLLVDLWRDIPLIYTSHLFYLQGLPALPETVARFIDADTVEHVKRWIDARCAEGGALFRAVGKGGSIGGRLSDRDVPRILKGMANAAGLDLDLSGHSCRVGAAQDMVAAGFALPEIMQSGGWKSPGTLARYSEHLAVRKGAAAKLAAQQRRA